MRGIRSDSSLRIVTQIIMLVFAPALSASAAWCTSTYSLRVLGTLAPDNSGYLLSAG